MVALREQEVICLPDDSEPNLNHLQYYRIALRISRCPVFLCSRLALP